MESGKVVMVSAKTRGTALSRKQKKEENWHGREQCRAKPRQINRKVSRVAALSGRAASRKQ